MAGTELAAADDVEPPQARATPWAWGICWLMFASTVLNYMDRQAVALVGTKISAEYQLSDVDFGWVLAAFSLTYALFQVPAGFLVDRWNTRWTYAGAVTWWSLAGMATAFSPSLGALMALRVLLGMGESFNWPCALRVTATILPPADRSLGNGIFNSGAAVGAVLTPFVVAPLAEWYGWRTPFLLIGGLGFVWVGVWLVLLGGARREVFAGRSASRSGSGDAAGGAAPGLSGTALAAFGGVGITALVVTCSTYYFGRPAIWWGITTLMVGLLLAARLVPLPDLEGAYWARSLGAIVRLRRFWVLVVVSISINVCWHFLINWLPKYLENDRGMTFLVSGLLSAVPFVAADVGNLGGGALSRFFAGRGLAPARARMIVMAFCTILVTTGASVGWLRNDTMVIAVIAVMALGTAAYMANYFSFTQEVSPPHTGLIVGILGGLGNLFAAGFHPVAGYLKQASGSFAPLFVVVGLLPYVGTAALLWGWGSADPAGEAKPS